MAYYPNTPSNGRSFQSAPQQGFPPPGTQMNGQPHMQHQQQQQYANTFPQYATGESSATQASTAFRRNGTVPVMPPGIGGNNAWSQFQNAGLAPSRFPSNAINPTNFFPPPPPPPPPPPSMRNIPYQKSAPQFPFPPSTRSSTRDIPGNWIASDSLSRQNLVTDREDGEVSDIDLSSGPAYTHEPIHESHPQLLDDARDSQRTNQDAAHVYGSVRSRRLGHSSPKSHDPSKQTLNRVPSTSQADGSPFGDQARPPRRDFFRDRMSMNGQKRSSAESSPRNTTQTRDQSQSDSQGARYISRLPVSLSPLSPPLKEFHSHGIQSLSRPPDPGVENGLDPAKNEAAAREFVAKQRNNAKEFLLCMHEHNYTYNQLVENDLDPTILKSLYDELGIPITASEPESQSRINGQPRTTPKEESRSTHLRRHPSRSINVSTSQSKPSCSSSSVPGLLSLPQQKRIGGIGMSPAMAESSDNPKVERKDLIAQLMAAKAKKQPNTVVSQYAQDPSHMTVNKSLTKSKQTVESQTSDISEIIRPDNVFSNADSSLEDKRKAQTELARRRIEELGIARKALASKANAQPSAPTKNRDPEISSSVDVIFNDLSADTSESPESGINGLTDVYDTDTATPQRSTAVNDPLISRQQTSTSKTSKHIEEDFEDGGVGIPGLVETLPPSWAANTSQVPRSYSDHTHTSAATALANDNVRTRKRPVASDFDTEPMSLTMKRPFGQDRYAEDSEGMIIEVSDDDSEDEVTEDRDLSIAQEENGMSTAETEFVRKPFIMRGLPTRMDDLPRAIFTGSSNVSSSNPGTPSTFQNTMAQRDADKLKRQEEEIATMKRKIAEAEMKRKAKAVTSGAQTPNKTLQNVTNPPSSVPVEKLNQKVGDPLLDSSSRSGNQEPISTNTGLSGLATQETEAATNPAGEDGHVLVASSTLVTRRQTSVDWKQKRRAEIQSGLPAIEASFTSKQSKLQQLKLQMQELEASLRVETESKQKLIDELESLGVDTEGMDHNELQATKDDMVARTEAEDKIASPELLAVDEIRRASIDSYNSSVSMITSENDTGLLHRSGSSLNGDDAVSPTQLSGNDPIESSISYSKDPTGSGNEDRLLVVDPSEKEESRKSSTVDSNLLERQSARESGEDKATSSETDNMEISDVFGSESGEIDSDQLLATQKPLPNSPKRTSNGEAESKSPYNEVQISHDDTDGSEVSDEYEPLDSLVSMTESKSADDEETYEPPAATIQKLNMHPTVTSPSIPILNSTAEIKGLLVSTNEPDTVAEGPGTDPPNDLQSTVQNTLDNPPDATSHLSPANRFTPYESPLKQFRAYRFHPEFENTVSGGFRSMSFAHNINPDNPICEYELAGGICNDNTCSSQHFRSMTLDDSTILIQLGTSNPGRTEEEKDKWTEGLRHTLNELKESGNETPESVAASISAYRRVFFKDPSRILDI